MLLKDRCKRSLHGWKEGVADVGCRHVVLFWRVWLRYFCNKVGYSRFCVETSSLRLQGLDPCFPRIPGCLSIIKGSLNSSSHIQTHFTGVAQVPSARFGRGQELRRIKMPGIPALAAAGSSIEQDCQPSCKSRGVCFPEDQAGFGGSQSWLSGQRDGAFFWQVLMYQKVEQKLHPIAC